MKEALKFLNKPLTIRKYLLTTGYTTGRNDGFENVAVLKCESRTRTQSRIRSQI